MTWYVEVNGKVASEHETLEFAICGQKRWLAYYGDNALVFITKSYDNQCPHCRLRG